MLLLLLLPILVSGFIYIHSNVESYYKLHRQEGQYLYLNTIKVGLVLTIVSFFICFLFNMLPPFKFGNFSFDFVKILEREFKILFNTEIQARQFSWILIISTTSISTAYIYPWLIEKFKIFKIFTELLKENFELIIRDSIKFKARFKRTPKYISSNCIIQPYLLYIANNKHFERLNRKLRIKAKILYKTEILGRIIKDSPLDRLLLDAFNGKKLVMFTLRNRQVYIGRVSSTGEPTENKGVDQEVCLIPIMSGYRDEKSLSVDLITHYREIDKTIYLTLRQDEIISATEFDLNAYETFKKQKLKKKGLSLNINW